MRPRALIFLAALLLLGGCGRSAEGAGRGGAAAASTSRRAPTTTFAATAATTTYPARAITTSTTTPTTPSVSARTTTGAARPVTRTTTGAPTSTTWAPSSPAPTPSDSGWALLDAWLGHNRTAALTDATPAAVAALFSYNFPPGGVEYRGCSSPPGNTASSCVYRDGNDLLSLTVSLFPHGWAVTGAVLES